MRKTLLWIGVVLGAVLLFFGGSFAASEGGEVVVLESYDAQGQPHHTRIWIADDHGVLWLRGGPESGWVMRTLVNPEIVVERAGQRGEYRASPDHDPERRDRVNALMREKYGYADRWVGLTLFDPDRKGALPIRLDPR